jgi:ribosomal protein S4
MRNKSKYKIFGKVGLFLKKYPLKILTFKRPKWNIFKKKDLKKNTNTTQNYSKIKGNCTFWLKKKNFFKYGKEIKDIVSCLFSNSIKHKNIEKQAINKKERTLFLTSCLIKPILRIDILLYFLNVCRSAKQAKQLIYSKKVLVNNEVLSCYKKFLNLGDIITFNDLNIDLIETKKVSIKYAQLNTIFSFIEIDYYTNSFVIVKNLNGLSFKDISLSRVEYIDAHRYFLTV